MAKRIIKLIATCIYLGYSPVVPGTMVSLAGALVYLLVSGSIIAYTILLLLIMLLGFLVCGKAEEIFAKKDSRKIVIDDLCGMLITYFLIPYTTVNLIAGFFLFRIIDISKPYPIRRLERLSGSRGVMLDDILAGIYANILLGCIQYII